MHERHIEHVMKKLDRRSERSPRFSVNYNTDPIATETYERLFDRLVHKDDVICNIGAGLAVDPTQIANHLNRSIWEATKRKEAHLVVADISHDNLITHKDLKEVTLDDHVSVVEADVLKLPIPDASVIGIVSSNLINCPSDTMSLKEQAEHLFDEAVRVLRPGGFLLLSSFGYLPLESDEKGVVYNDDIRESDILSLRDTEKLLESKGFINISELDVDWEKMEVIGDINDIYNHAKEIGGFLAYKPK